MQCQFNVKKCEEENDVYELQNIKVALKFSIDLTLNKFKIKINVNTLEWHYS